MYRVKKLSYFALISPERTLGSSGKFLQRYEGKHILFLELGVGGNTPGIIKYPFWRMTMQNKKAVYVCINKGEAFVPKDIATQSICLDGDIGEVLEELHF